MIIPNIHLKAPLNKVVLSYVLYFIYHIEVMTYEELSELFWEKLKLHYTILYQIARHTEYTFFNDLNAQ
jgi:hypothetical protein